jgi:hypothetical protein
MSGSQGPEVDTWAAELLTFARTSAGGAAPVSLTEGLGGGEAPSASMQGLETSQEGLAVCSYLHREVRIQFRFVIFYQVIMAVLSAATALLLIGSFWRLWEGHAGVEQIVTLAGGVVTGVAAGFLTKNVKGARKEYKSALKALKSSNCP